MDALESNLDKKYLLDLLAYLLWEEKTAHELSFSHINLCKRLYQEILQELKNQAAHWKNSSHQDDFGAINLQCQDLGNLFFLEKRLELIEERLASKKVNAF